MVFDGESVVRLTEVWKAAAFAADLERLMFDFVGDDGLCPSVKRRTKLLGPAIARGYVERASRRLRWESALQLPCFYNVRGVATIVAEDRAA